MKNRRLLFGWIALVFWMILIFYMSHQPGDISTKQSDLVVKIFQMIGLDLNKHLGELATFLIRKIAHFTEYFILCFLMINVLKYYFNIKIAIFYGFIFTVCYASIDEIHQYFIPGRAMALKDVAIDSIGAFFAMVINRILIVKKEFNGRVINRVC